MIDAIARRDFAHWTGLPGGLAPADLGADGDPETWALRHLGDDHVSTRFRVVDLAGYYRPTVSVRDGAVVLFDGMNPETDFAALVAALGEPEARHDYAFGTLPVPAGEWVYAARGLTLFVNTDPDRVLHVALYAATTPGEYAARLRPQLKKTLR